MKRVYEQKSQNFIKKIKSKFKAFTLAEVITVIVLWGVVSAIIIPSTIKKHSETVKRAKIKKALETYNAVIERIVVEHRFKTTAALDDWAAGPNGNCANARAYFNISETRENCIFKTHDGIWWYLNSNDRLRNGKRKVSMSRAIVSLKLSTTNAEAKNVNLLKNNLYKKASREDWYDTFFFVTTFDSKGSPRILDLQYGMQNGDWAQLSPSIKVYGFFDKKDFFDYMPLNDNCGYTVKDKDDKDVKITNCCRLTDHGTSKYCVPAKGSALQNPTYCKAQNNYNGDNFNACGGRIGSGVNFNPCERLTNKDKLNTCKTGGIGGVNTGLLDQMGLPYVPLQYNNDNFHSTWGSKCANSLGDDCNEGTVGFSMRSSSCWTGDSKTSSCTKSQADQYDAYLKKYAEDHSAQLYSENMKAIIAQIGGTSDGYAFSSISTTYYDFDYETGIYSNAHTNEDNTPGHPEKYGYLYQSGQTDYTYTNSDGKKIKFTIKPDGYVYYNNPDTTVGGTMRCAFNNITNCSVCRTSAEHAGNCL